MGKDHKDLKLPKWVMFSCSILEITTIACFTPCSAIPSHLIHIIVPSSMLSQTTLYEQRALYSIFNYIKLIPLLFSYLELYPFVSSVPSFSFLLPWLLGSIS